MKPEQKNISRTPHEDSRTPFYVLIFALILTVLATVYVHYSSQAEETVRFDSAVKRTKTKIDDKIETYIAVLRGVAGLFLTREDITRDEFRFFIERLRIKELYKEMQGIGFAARVSHEELSSLIQKQQQQGFQYFKVTPDDVRAEYYPVVYLEPYNDDKRNQAVIGYDMFTEARRRAAM